MDASIPAEISDKISEDCSKNTDGDLMETSSETEEFPSEVVSYVDGLLKVEVTEELPVDKITPCTCHICLKTFGRKRDLNIHLRIHTNEKPFQCELCGKEFAQVSGLRAHLRTHTKEKPFICEFCDKAFGQPGHLQKHLTTHAEEKPFKCLMCPKEFARKESLDNHVLLHAKQPYICKYCKEEFYQESTWQIHLRNHTNKKIYKCDICSKEFLKKSNLEGHSRTHSSEKQYKCEFCQMPFAHNTTLLRHLRRKHKESYACSKCKKVFAKMTDLESHIGTHDLERPHKCELCGKEFLCKGSLLRHIRQQHRNTVVPVGLHLNPHAAVKEDEMYSEFNDDSISVDSVVQADAYQETLLISDCHNEDFITAVPAEVIQNNISKQNDNINEDFNTAQTIKEESIY